MRGVPQVRYSRHLHFGRISMIAYRPLIGYYGLVLALHVSQTADPIVSNPLYIDFQRSLAELHQLYRTVWWHLGQGRGGGRVTQEFSLAWHPVLLHHIQYAYSSKGDVC